MSTRHAIERARSDTITLELVRAMLDDLPQTPFFALDADLRFIGANNAMLDVCGVRRRSDLIGKTQRDFFGAETSRHIEAMDRSVLRLRRAVRDKLEFRERLRGTPLWLLLTRKPIIGARDEIRGVVAVGRVLSATHHRNNTFRRLALALEYVHADYASAPSVSDLGERVGLSPSQLERALLDVFGLTPRRYLTKVRIEAALELLADERPIAEVAQAVGYSDQSAFTRRFQAVMGSSPSEFRRLLGPANAP